MTDTIPPAASVRLRPASAVGAGTGIAGFFGLGAWVCIARAYGMDGPLSAMTSVFCTGIPMALWLIFKEKVHLRASTGLDWSHRRPLRETLDISLTKLAGYWTTWGVIALTYCLCRWYWSGDYLFSMRMLRLAAPVVVGLSIPYVFWLDRYLVNPRDGAWHFGALLVGQEKGDREKVYNHMRSWLVKGFYLAFMISIVPGGFHQIINANIPEIVTNPVWIASWLITAMFVIDVQFATIGYMLTMKPLDAHIRTANPYMSAWVAALICYPPFILMYPGGPLDYATSDQSWKFWFDGNASMLAIWGTLLVVLTAVYAWATVAFGLRFSNLTNRGIITNGPYKFTKHPAYVAKNSFWWCACLPFLVESGSFTDMVRNTALLAAVSGVYFWRAKTEEKHLMADPDYRAYAAWANENAVLPRLIGRITGRIGPAEPQAHPAE